MHDPARNRGRACRGCAGRRRGCPACEPRTYSAARAAAGIPAFRRVEDAKPKHRCSIRIVRSNPTRIGCQAGPESSRSGPAAGQAALVVLSLLTYPGTGRPMMRASPHSVQPHSWQSPSGASGQLAGSAWNCSNSRSSLQPLQYLLRCVILATSSWRCIIGCWRGADRG